MSIHIQPETAAQPRPQRKTLHRAPGQIAPLIQPRPAQLYQNRAQRLRQLAQHNPIMHDYLHFAALIASAQHHAQQQHPLLTPDADISQHIHAAAQQGRPPLDMHQLPRLPRWHHLFDTLMACLQPQLNGAALATVNLLASTRRPQREQMANALLSQQFAVIGSDKAPFIWAALSLYWAQLAGIISVSAQARYGEARQFCPMCGSVPVVGIIKGGAQQGLRYLHCNLCESQWHVVRIKCSNCEQSGKLNYWSIDRQQSASKNENIASENTINEEENTASEKEDIKENIISKNIAGKDAASEKENTISKNIASENTIRKNENIAIKCESCDDCGSYLKLLYQNNDATLEPVADDLASLMLDIHTEQQGYARSAFNPLLFPAESD